MELKPSVRFPFPRPLPCLNRTFYGIETGKIHRCDGCVGLNRTFYGIETTLLLELLNGLFVLIVPFMELKPNND